MTVQLQHLVQIQQTEHTSSLFLAEQAVTLMLGLVQTALHLQLKIKYTTWLLVLMQLLLQTQILVLQLYQILWLPHLQQSILQLLQLTLLVSKEQQVLSTQQLLVVRQPSLTNGLKTAQTSQLPKISQILVQAHTYLQ